jgi:hypothetical protein
MVPKRGIAPRPSHYEFFRPAISVTKHARHQRVYAFDDDFDVTD